MQQRQLLTLGGLASVILLVIAFGVSGDAPGAGDSSATVRAFYVDHSSGQRIGAYLLMIAVPCLVFFAVAVRSVLVETSPERNRLWGTVLVAGSVLAGGGLLLTACLQLALASSPEHLGGAATQALNAFSIETWPALTGGLGVLLLGAAGAMIPLRSGLRWLGWTALVLGVLIFTPAGFFAFAGCGLWIVLTSVAMTMRLRAPQTGLREHAAAS